MRIRPGRRKHGDYRADVLAVDLFDADQAGGLARAVADGLPQPCGVRCLAPGRTAPGQNEDEEVPRQGGSHQSKSASGTYTTPSKMRRAVRTNEARSTTGVAPDRSVTRSTSMWPEGCSMLSTPPENPFGSM